MKESTKYNSYRFVGTINIDEIMPWFDFDKGEPWDESEVPWVLENKVRREILLRLAHLGPKSLEEIHSLVNFSPNPLIIQSNEYSPSIEYQWEREVVQNHLMNLEWYGLIRNTENGYEVTFPVFSMEDLEQMDNFIIKFANSWFNVVKDIKNEFNQENIPLGVLIEKTVEKLYQMLKDQGFLPNIPNLKLLWAEELRKIKFEEWLRKNF